MEEGKAGRRSMAKNIMKSLRNLKRTLSPQLSPPERRAPASSGTSYIKILLTLVLFTAKSSVDPNNVELKLLPIPLIAATSVTVPWKSSVFYPLGLQISTKAMATCKRV